MKVRLSQNCFEQFEIDLYLNTTIGQLKNLPKLEHHADVKTEQMIYENSPQPMQLCTS